MSQDVWGDYVAATQELDLVQRVAGPGRGGAGPDTVRAELARLRDRLAAQRTALRAAGCHADLAPAPAEAHAATGAVGTDPTRALTALRQAAALTDAADSLLRTTGAPVGGAARPVAWRWRWTWPWEPRGPWRQNLLVYGPFAAVAFGVNLVLYAASPAVVPAFALLWMVLMAALAFGLGWLVLGLVAGVGLTARAATLDRTPQLGGAVCAAPLLFALAGLF
ncbi:MAG TPA: hypothetical protein VFY17_07345 [Pilimelia sp.]|nr:hypothetical protein [Pilimelia sp.]